MSSATHAMIELARMGQRLREAPKVLDAVLPELAAVVRDYLLECYARGVDADGVPWPATEAGAAPAITGQQMEVIHFARKILVRLRWYNALHSIGGAKGGVQRRMVPAGELPAELRARMDAVVTARLAEALAP
jgi:hypothetical protein